MQSSLLGSAPCLVHTKHSRAVIIPDGVTGSSSLARQRRLRSAEPPLSHVAAGSSIVPGRVLALGFTDELDVTLLCWSALDRSSIFLLTFFRRANGKSNLEDVSH